MKQPKLPRKASWTVLLLIPISLALQANESANGNSEKPGHWGVLSATNFPDPKRIIQNAQDRLRKQFDKWLQQPNDYAKRVVAECSVFPEGEVYPFALPAIAYCNLARDNLRVKIDAVATVPKLIDL